jgi:glycerophosphoryl diester phosphodiesterase
MRRNALSPNQFATGDKVVSIIAHRGASGFAVENSIAAFRLAAELGADGAELDVHATADGAIVVHHDPVLPDGRWIRDLRAEEVRRHRLLTGEPPPFLSEVLAAAPALRLWIEVKALEPRWDGALLAVIDEAPDRCAIHSFDHRLIARLGRLRPSLARGVLSVSYPVDPLAQLRDAGANTLWQEWQLIDRDLVDLVHGAGCRIIAWTVNDRAVAAHLSALGVDGLCGNYPDRLRLT